eukprot:jgi/Chrzof1/2088/Cz11g02100.t1
MGSKRLRHVMVAARIPPRLDPLIAALPLLTALPHLPALSVDAECCSDDGRLLRCLSSTLSCMTQLKQLSLYQLTAMPYDGLQVLSQLRALKLSSICKVITAEQLETLGNSLPYLQYLTIQVCEIAPHDEDIASLASTLKTAQLGLGLADQQEGFSTKLGLVSNQLASSAVARPQPFTVFRNLRLLSLYGSKLWEYPHAWQPLLPCLMQLPYLRFLDLAEVNTNLDELDDLPMLTQLHYLHLEKHQVGAGASHKMQGAPFVVYSTRPTHRRGAVDVFDDLIHREVVIESRV